MLWNGNAVQAADPAAAGVWQAGSAGRGVVAAVARAALPGAGRRTAAEAGAAESRCIPRTTAVARQAVRAGGR